MLYFYNIIILYNIKLLHITLHLFIYCFLNVLFLLQSSDVLM